MVDSRAAVHRSQPTPPEGLDTIATMAWQEIGDRVFTRKYRFFNQQIGVVLGGRDVLVVDTRSTPAQAREIASDLRELTRDPVSIIVDTHWHFDHSFGNSVFRPAAAWGHVRAADRLRADGRTTIDEVAAEIPEIAADIRETVIDPPENTFEDRATVAVGDRVVELSFHGRAHTDGDIVLVVPDANVMFAGDLLEEGAPPSFGDSFPLEWPATVEQLIPLAAGPVVPGHGAIGDRSFVEQQLAAFRGLAELARSVHDGSLDLRDAIAEQLFYGVATPEDAFERALAQLRGVLD
jgi:glyoxylase-like metal-dependent hydrolase (beta-lactamase superfamily II)